MDGGMQCECGGEVRRGVERVKGQSSVCINYLKDKFLTESVSSVCQMTALCSSTLAGHTAQNSPQTTFITPVCLCWTQCSYSSA